MTPPESTEPRAAAHDAVLYSRGMRASEWRAILDRIPSAEFRAQVIEEMGKHAPNDMISVRFDHLLCDNPDNLATITPTEPRTEAVESFCRDMCDGDLTMDYVRRRLDVLLDTIAPTEPGRVVIEMGTLLDWRAEAESLADSYGGGYQLSEEITKYIAAIIAAAERAATGGA